MVVGVLIGKCRIGSDSVGKNNKSVFSQQKNDNTVKHKIGPLHKRGGVRL